MSTREHTVIHKGIPLTVMLSDEDAERLGAEPIEGAPAKKAATPANKARQPEGK